MRNSISKAIVAGLPALAISAAVIAPTTPASAQQWRGGGWHGGGWHGGGWGGGAWRGGGWHRGWGGGGWWGPAVVGGLAAGAIATSPYWAGNGYGNGCWTYQPVYDAYGRYIGQQSVNIC